MKTPQLSLLDKVAVILTALHSFLVEPMWPYEPWLEASPLDEAMGAGYCGA